MNSDLIVEKMTLKINHKSIRDPSPPVASLLMHAAKTLRPSIGGLTHPYQTHNPSEIWSNKQSTASNGKEDDGSII